MGCNLSCFLSGEATDKCKNYCNSKMETKIQVTKLEKTSQPSVSNFNEDEIDLSHFKLHEKCIGVGGFGIVRMVTKLTDADKGTSYALKTLNKERILERSSGPNSVMTELKALAILKGCKFICNIHYAFQDSNYLHMIVDLAIGGDLRCNMRKMPCKRFPEEMVKFYACQIMLALHSCHVHSILHRDVKPENIVLMGNGYLKLTDFGVAKILENIEDCRSTSGTHGYMAPEIYFPLHRHGTPSDWFSLGVTIFELLLGRRPFESQRLMAFKDKAVHCDTLPLINLQKYSFISEDCKVFLGLLLQVKPSTRLGSKHGIEEFKSEKWLKSMPWDMIWNQTLQPPFAPEKNNDIPAITSNLSNDEKCDFKLDAKMSSSKISKADEVPTNSFVQNVFKEYGYRNKYYDALGTTKLSLQGIIRVPESMNYNEMKDDDTEEYDSYKFHCRSAYPYTGRIVSGHSKQHNRNLQCRADGTNSRYLNKANYDRNEFISNDLSFEVVGERDEPQRKCDSDMNLNIDTHSVSKSLNLCVDTYSNPYYASRKSRRDNESAKIDKSLDKHYQPNNTLSKLTNCDYSLNQSFNNDELRRRSPSQIQMFGIFVESDNAIDSLSIRNTNNRNSGSQSSVDDTSMKIFSRDTYNHQNQDDEC